jgi:hypothetical protein
VKRLLMVAAVLLTLSYRPDGDRKLGGRIAEVVARGDGTVLRMSEVAPFPWTCLHIFEAYTQADQIERELNVPCEPCRSVGLEMRDDVSLLVFLNDNRVERYLAHKRNRGDFSGLMRAQGYTPMEAVFRVRSEGGWPRIVLSGRANDA